MNIFNYLGYTLLGALVIIMPILIIIGFSYCFYNYTLIVFWIGVCCMVLGAVPLFISGCYKIGRDMCEK